jgi:hypothetical protein
MLSAQLAVQKIKQKTPVGFPAGVLAFIKRMSQMKKNFFVGSGGGGGS